MDIVELGERVSAVLPEGWSFHIDSNSGVYKCGPRLCPECPERRVITHGKWTWALTGPYNLGDSGLIDDITDIEAFIGDIMYTIERDPEICRCGGRYECDDEWNVRCDTCGGEAA